MATQLTKSLGLITSTLPKRIVFQGEFGANSHIACQEAFPDFEPVPCETFEATLAEVQEERAPLAMIPIENTVAGRVADIHTLLPSSELNIIGEYFLPIRHQLLGIRGAKVEEIKEVWSHVHAIGQCRAALNKLGVKAVVASDTAGSARQVSEMGDPHIAAIATRLAAETYNLEILKADIEDEKHNTTRFIVMTKGGLWAEADQAKVVTTFIFQVRNIPASLYKCLGGFATNGLNMTKLESYQIDGTFYATRFYADVEGHPKDPGFKHALDELDFFCEDHRILGVYPGGSARS